MMPSRKPAPKGSLKAIASEQKAKEKDDKTGKKTKTMAETVVVPKLTPETPVPFPTLPPLKRKRESLAVEDIDMSDRKAEDMVDYGDSSDPSDSDVDMILGDHSGKEKEMPPPKRPKLDKSTRKAKLEELKASGDKPPTPCGTCQSNDHWAADCPVRKQRKAEKKQRAKEKKKAQKASSMTNSPNSTPSKPKSKPKAKKAPSQASTNKGSRKRRDSTSSSIATLGSVSFNSTKRGETDPQDDDFNDGRRIVIKVPAAIKAGSLTTSSIITIWKTAGLKVSPERMTPLAANNWLATMRNIDDMEQAVGKVLTWKKGFEGLKKDETTVLELYNSRGPQMFICQRVSTSSDDVIMTKIQEFLPGKRFFYAKDVYDGDIEGGARLVSFQDHLPVYTFTIQMQKDFSVRFRAVNRESVCALCKGPHKVWTCGAWQAVIPTSPKLQDTFLNQMPALK